MRVERTSAGEFNVEFESEEELREEYRTNLALGALCLPTAETVPLHTKLLIKLRGPWGGQAEVRGTAVAPLPNAIALAIEASGDEVLAQLLQEVAAPVETEEKKQNTWDRVRSLSQIEKLLLAVKADRTERAVLIQDNDPRVLLSLLRNPQLTVDEVVRVAKSPFMTYQVVDVIVKTAQWMANLDVRISLIHNPKTPSAFGLRILPTLPETEIKAIARAGTSMALKQAALRRLQGKTS